MIKSFGAVRWSVLNLAATTVPHGWWRWHSRCDRYLCWPALWKAMEFIVVLCFFLRFHGYMYCARCSRRQLAWEQHGLDMEVAWLHGCRFSPSIVVNTQCGSLPTCRHKTNDELTPCMLNEHSKDLKDKKEIMFKWPGSNCCWSIAYWFPSSNWAFFWRNWGANSHQDPSCVSIRCTCWIAWSAGN